ncbi:MAG TPA: nuclear transport factor 2 family protein [Burkholderiales bacterium]|nr:nuclear transport factor 2 family protein [Burkholderiales bacterium]
MQAAHVDALISIYEGLSAKSVECLADVYAPDAYFKDPFNEVNGIDEIQAIFHHMYRQIEEPRFVVHQWSGTQDDGFLVWDMRFRSRMMRGDPEQVIRGVSHIRFNGAGKVTYHRDYWDTGEELYAKLPVIGWLIGWLRKKLA